MVDLTLWCLEHKYNKRPKFKDLRSMIIKYRNKDKKQKFEFRRGNTRNFDINKKKRTRPKPSVQSMKNFGIQSNIMYKKDITSESNRDVLVESIFQNLVDEKEFKTEPVKEDFVIEPVNITEESIKEDKNSGPFGNDYESVKEPAMKRYKQKIFEESQDIYYREVKKEGLVNYKTLGSQFLKKEGDFGFEMIDNNGTEELPERYIRAKHE